MRTIYQLQIAGMRLNYRFFDPETVRYFRPFISGIISEGLPDLETTMQDMARWTSVYPEALADSALEQRIMLLKLSGYLSRKNACVIHACAAVWKERAWLFTGSSGSGKTTLYRNWRSYLGEAVQILCGDMPFVAVQADGTVRVYPSPWNGKEHYGSLIDAQLGGVLYLAQGNENRMTRMTPSMAAAPLYTQLLCESDSGETVECLAAIDEAILQSVPVWHFINRGDAESAAVSCGTIEQYLREMTV